MKQENVSLSESDKLSFISNLSTMLSSGISILEIIDSLLEDAKGNQKKILEVLRQDLIQGKRIHASFAKFPATFDKVTVNIIKAAEEAGTLEITLKDLKENTKKEMEFKDKIKSALIYPILIIIAFLAVLLLILTFVIPKISDVFYKLKLKLPITTKILIFTSDLLLSYTLPIIAICLFLLIIFYFIYKKKRKSLFTILSSLPLISRLVREIDLTRFSRSFSLLLSAGLPITMALELSQEVVTRKEIEKAIISCQETILSGKTLSEGLKKSKGVVPSIMIKIIEAGEKSGTLEKSMQDISEYFDYQVSKTLALLTILIEPILLGFIGIFVGGLVLSILTPIYGLISQISSGF